MKTKKKINANRLPFVLFIISVAIFVFLYGVGVGRYRIFPYVVFDKAADGLRGVALLVDKDRHPFYRRVENPKPVPVSTSPEAYEGLNLVTRVANNNRLVAEIMTMDGRTLHQWDIDWFELWPDAEHVPERVLPKWRPGTQIHGAVVLENGDLIFNFEHLGLVRMSRAGEVMWRLPYQTHHSIQRDENGNLWVCGEKNYTKMDPRFPNRRPPFYEYTILEVTPDGEIVEEISVDDLLQENGLIGLLYLGALGERSTQVRGGADTLHMNDVEPFPASMEEDFFEHGDIMVSLRNINTVFVFNRSSQEIKFIATGWFVRQHDPDFIDGNRFSVFDNYLIAPETQGHQSRIVIVSAREEAINLYFEGNSDVHFYTDVMGKHQWLPNGNLLITESVPGRAFEINEQGEVVWEYINYVEDEYVGVVEEVTRLGPDYDQIFDSREQDSVDGGAQ